MDQVKKLIEKLNLVPHPEGGYYKETYRSFGMIDESSLASSYSGKRNYSTCIYFLLTSEMFSAFHKIQQDEIWHFYSGSPIVIHMISDDGIYSKALIGNNFAEDQIPQFVVKGGCWFASEVVNNGNYGLVGCTVSPGFDFEDFELPSRNDLANRFPQLREIITRLTNN